MSGRLTLKGQTHNVTVPVILAQSGATGTATGTFTLKRSDLLTAWITMAASTGCGIRSIQ